MSPTATAARTIELALSLDHPADARDKGIPHPRPPVLVDCGRGSGGMLGTSVWENARASGRCGSDLMQDEHAARKGVESSDPSIRGLGALPRTAESNGGVITLPSTSFDPPLQSSGSFPDPLQSIAVRGPGFFIDFIDETRFRSMVGAALTLVDIGAAVVLVVLLLDRYA